ncbi:MAG: DNA-directed RNA polymerase subunit B, partial [Methanosarcinales archaeon]|nr:DNA-directed RNA polymerase subunit B [Methanosarcinales archaeon]
MRGKVFLDGELVGTHENTAELVHEIRMKRRQGIIDGQLNVALQGHDVLINTDMGRARRPSIVVEGGRSRITDDHIEQLKNGDLDFNDLVSQGLIEYLDAEEEENALIAVSETDITPEHTHLEIEPALILGIGTGMVPFPEHNASPRNTMGAAMIKQCIGLPAANTKLRSDTRGHVLH